MRIATLAVTTCIFALAACASKSNAFVGSWQDTDRTTGYVFQSNGVVHVITKTTRPMDVTYDLKDGSTAVLHAPMGINDIVTIGSDGLLHDNQAGMMKPIVLHRVSQVAIGNQ